MKIAMLVIALAAATSANAGVLQASSHVGTFFSGTSVGSVMTFEAANRKGSKRVGGSGRSGKGSRYVGGR